MVCWILNQVWLCSRQESYPLSYHYRPSLSFGSRGRMQSNAQGPQVHSWQYLGIFSVCSFILEVTTVLQGYSWFYIWGLCLKILAAGVGARHDTQLWGSNSVCWLLTPGGALRTSWYKQLNQLAINLCTVSSVLWKYLERSRDLVLGPGKCTALTYWCWGPQYTRLYLVVLRG